MWIKHGNNHDTIKTTETSHVKDEINGAFYSRMLNETTHHNVDSTDVFIPL